MNKTIVSQEFINDINKIQNVFLFKILYSTYEGDIADMTLADIEAQKSSLMTYDAETYLNDDVLTVHFFKDDFYLMYSGVILFYALEDTDDLSKWKPAFIIDGKKGDYADQDLQDYTQNWLYFDMRGFDIKCKFILRQLPPDSVFHDHSTVNYDEVDPSVKLANLLDFKNRILPIIQDNSETLNPTIIDGTYVTSVGMRILPDGKVVNDGQVIFTPEGERITSSENNLQILKQTNIAQEDKILDV